MCTYTKKNETFFQCQNQLIWFLNVKLSIKIKRLVTNKNFLTNHCMISNTYNATYHVIILEKIKEQMFHF